MSSLFSLFRLPSPGLVLLVVLGALPLAAQPALRWQDDLEAAQAAARECGRPVLVVATVGGRCPACRALEREVFRTGAYAERFGARFVHCRLDYRRSHPATVSTLLFAARAHLRGYPTLYLLDAEGWPFFAQHGYEPGHASALLDRLDAAQMERKGFERLRAGSEGTGLRALLQWYEQYDMPLGRTLAASRLYESSAPSEQAAFAPWLIAPAIVADGAGGAEPFLDVLRREDPAGERDLLTRGLHRAGSQLLRVADFTAATTCLDELVALESLPAQLRMDAEMSLGYAWRKRGDLRRAIAHYERAIAISEAADPEGGCCPWRAQAERRVASLRRRLRETDSQD